jgi:hypothetical protein
LAPGTYVLVIETNPARVFPEVSFDNNRQSVVVTVPAVEGVVDIPMRLETARFSSPGAALETFSTTTSPTAGPSAGPSAAPETFSTTTYALLMAIIVLATLTL